MMVAVFYDDHFVKANVSRKSAATNDNDHQWPLIKIRIPEGVRPQADVSSVGLVMVRMLHERMTIIILPNVAHHLH